MRSHACGVGEARKNVDSKGESKMVKKTKFRIQINKNETVACGTYLKDNNLSLGILTPDGDSWEWKRFLTNLKDGDILEVKKAETK